MEVDDDLPDELPIETDQGTTPLSQAILKAESELENALVHLMERRDYEATSLYAQLAIETIEAIERAIAGDSKAAEVSR